MTRGALARDRCESCGGRRWEFRAWRVAGCPYRPFAHVADGLTSRGVNLQHARVVGGRLQCCNGSGHSFGASQSCQNTANGPRFAMVSHALGPGAEEILASGTRASPRRSVYGNAICLDLPAKSKALRIEVSYLDRCFLCRAVYMQELNFTALVPSLECIVRLIV